MSASAARLTANRRPDLASSHGRGLAQYDGVVRVEGWGSAGPSGPAPSGPQCMNAVPDTRQATVPPSGLPVTPWYSMVTTCPPGSV